MRKKSVQILSTKKLEQDSLDDLICIAEVTDYDILQIIPVPVSKREFYRNIIFTSYKATLRGLEVLGNKASNHHYFCVGKKSEQHLKNCGLEVYGFANYSKDLAELLVENLRNSSFSYLCSEDRLSTLPDILKANEVLFEEVYTYKSEINNTLSKGDYDIFLWFSPKGVKSYSGQVKKNAVHICIGETTAGVTKEVYSSDQVFYPEVPRMEDVMMIARKKALEINLKKCTDSVTNH